MRNELQPVLMAVQELPAGELPRLLGELEEIRCTAMARLTAPAPPAVDDTLLGVNEAAGRLGMSVGYLYRHHSEFPFSRRMGKSLRFSSAGIQTYVSGKRVSKTR
jgi:predicted DNA-binding transcriptional regulator AlpA